MKHVMIDLETYGTKPGYGIVSIGAVFFDPKKMELGHELYTVVNRQSCREYGLKEDPDTMAWWERQSASAREALTQATEGKGLDLVPALTELTDFIKLSAGVLIYGNGNDFDKPILTVAYDLINTKEPWAPYNGRCYRTYKQEHKHPAPKRAGTHHNALDDAKFQAQHLMEMAKKHKLELL